MNENKIIKYAAALSFVALFLFMGTTLPINTIEATSIKVIAVVNGKPITNIDFEKRRNFLIKTTGINDTAERSQQIDSDVLQMLIDDIIKTEEGLRLGSGAESAALERAKALVDRSFSQHGEEADVVMSRLGIDRAFAEQKYLTDVLWISTVQSRFFQEFSNIKNEAEAELERIRTNALKPQVDLDEIVLVPEPNRNFNDTLETARQMVDAIRNGADFGRIAQQYSVSGSSQNGGDIGWVVIENLPDNIRSIVENLPLGSIADPVQIDGSVVIYRLNGKRENGTGAAIETEVLLGRLVLPEQAIDATSSETATSKMIADTADIRSCEQMQALHERYASGIEFLFGAFKMRDLAPQLQQILLPLDKNEMSEPISDAEGLSIFMVCDKRLLGLDLPTFEEVERSIGNRHFSVLSARYLSQLRRRAIIEYRNGT